VVAKATQPETSAGIGLASTRKASANPIRFPAGFIHLCSPAGALVIVLLFATAAYAQKGSTQHTPPQQPQDPFSEQPMMMPDVTPDPFGTLNTIPPDGVLSPDIGRIVDSEACNSWTESGVHSPTVSAKRLAVPPKAGSEFQKACGAFKGRKFPEAEEHLRKAIEIYPEYPAAWVVLGQVLESEKKPDEAQQACSKARDLDPDYVASYLCLEEFAANDGKWAQLSELSSHALAIDPIGNPYALYYAADAGLHLNQLTQAEMHAQSAVKLDKWHHLPELHLLLAQIYEAAGNVQGEVVQLREFLKVAPNSKDAARAKSTLAQVDVPAAKAQPNVP
jgi:hypothetical protein